MPAGTDDVYRLLSEMLRNQKVQTKLLEKIADKLEASANQKEALEAWKKQHSELGRRCKEAFKKLDQIQLDFLEKLTEAVENHDETESYSDYQTTELLDTYGPRLMYLNNLRLMLSHLSIGE